MPKQRTFGITLRGSGKKTPKQNTPTSSVFRFIKTAFMGKTVSFSLTREFCLRWAPRFPTQWNWPRFTLHPKASSESEFSIPVTKVSNNLVQWQIKNCSNPSSRNAVKVLQEDGKVTSSPVRCGLRAGYVELVNIDPEVMECIFKLFSKDSCAPVLGQIALDIMAKPPQPGDPSYPLYHTVRRLLAPPVFF